jgi:hypothetical protein
MNAYNSNQPLKHEADCPGDSSYCKACIQSRKDNTSFDMVFIWIFVGAAFLWFLNWFLSGPMGDYDPFN